MGRSLVTRADLPAPASNSNVPIATSASLPPSVVAGIRDLMIAFAAPSQEDVDKLHLLRIYADAVSGFDVTVVERALQHLKFRNPRNPFRPTPQDVFEACESIKNYGGAMVFAPSAKFAAIAYNTVTPAHANLILRKVRKHVPEATTVDVEEALVEISDAFVAKDEFGFEKKKQPEVTIKEIIAEAVDEICKKYAYAKHGGPEQLAGEPVARYRVDRDGDSQLMHSELVAISQATLDSLVAKYPLAAPACAIEDDGTGYLESRFLTDLWLDVRASAKARGWSAYGRQGQIAAHADVERFFSMKHKAEQERMEREAQKECWLANQVDRPGTTTEEKREAAQWLRYHSGWLDRAKRGDISAESVSNEVEEAFRAVRRRQE